MRRLVINLLAAICFAAAIVIVVDGSERAAEREEAIAQTRDAVRMLQVELDVHVAVESGPLGERKYPSSISPAWFEAQRPVNALLRADSPWVEVAAADEIGLRHPRDPTVEGGHGAMFWYNPALGVVRARVPRTLTDADAIALYNQVNGTSIVGLKAISQAEDRD
ncbi:MAG: hypothetical protein U0572_05235 [Phycisphaerales bacterium]